MGARVAQEYLRGRSIRKLAKELGWSYSWVNHLPREQDIKLRSRGGRNPAKGETWV
ncbi:MAG: helix-turn-helix domain-containing protein [Pseudonocardiaceae bacterium]